MLLLNEREIHTVLSLCNLALSFNTGELFTERLKTRPEDVEELRKRITNSLISKINLPGTEFK